MLQSVPLLARRLLLLLPPLPRLPAVVANRLQGLLDPAQLQEQYQYRIVLPQHVLPHHQRQRPARLHSQAQAPQLLHPRQRRREGLPPPAAAAAAGSWCCWRQHVG